MSGEAWSALALALHLDGDHAGAVDAGYRAVSLEPNEVRHWLRYGYVGWGAPRLEAAHHALKVAPDLGLGYWLTATVFIARGAFELAFEIVRQGCAAQDRQSTGILLPALGLHLLHGQLLAAHDRLDEAAAELQRELALVDDGLLWGRECAANTWYALGAVRLRQRKPGEADAAFRRALDIADGHLPSLAALGRPLPRIDAGDPRAADAAIARSIGLARAGRRAEAAATCRELLAGDPSPAAGWILPVEPILHPAADPALWADILDTVRARAL